MGRIGASTAQAASPPFASSTTLAAVHAYLHRYRDRPVTLRAYTRELERLILWGVVI
jgi:hypothetical protein